MFCPCSAIAQDAGPPAPHAAEPQPAPWPHGIGRALYAFSIGGQLADAATTWHFESSGRLVAQKQRLRGLGPARLFAVKAGVGLGCAVLGDIVTRSAERHKRTVGAASGPGHPVIIGGTGFFIAARNVLSLARARGHGGSLAGASP